MRQRENYILFYQKNSNKNYETVINVTTSRGERRIPDSVTHRCHCQDQWECLIEFILYKQKSPFCTLDMVSFIVSITVYSNYMPLKKE
jgi:hypothetical protein